MRGTRITPSRFGYKVFALLLLFVMAFLATPYSNPVFALLAWCGSMLVLDAVWAWRNVAGIRATTARCDGAPADRPRQLEIELDGGGRWRRGTALAVEFDGEWLEILPCPAFRGVSRVELSLPGLPRGVHQMPRCRIQALGPLGLWLAHGELLLDLELVTWPRPSKPCPARRRAHPALAGSAAGVRPFLPGDSPGRVDWKASARRGDLVVREREDHDREFVELDRRCDPDEFERRLSIATAAILEAVASGRAVEIRSEDFSGGTGSKKATGELLRWLAEAQPIGAEEEES